MRFLILIFILIGVNTFGQIKVGGFSEKHKIMIDSSLNLIKEKDSFKYSRLVEFCKVIKYSDIGTSRVENDSIIVISKSILDPESINKVACSIVHETKRLELLIKKYNYTPKKEEYSCYAYEYAFSCRINCEDWLKEQIQEALIQHQ
jgi:hypothetical protein